MKYGFSSYTNSMFKLAAYIIFKKIEGLCFDCILSANEKSEDNESHLAGDKPQNGIHSTW